MNAVEALQTLRERRDWLRARIEAKRSVDWDITWDVRECESLTWVLDNFPVGHLARLTD